LKA
jgi:hypothetical protein